MPLGTLAIVSCARVPLSSDCDQRTTGTHRRHAPPSATRPPSTPNVISSSANEMPTPTSPPEDPSVNKIHGHMAPPPEDLLEAPLALHDRAGFMIVEWAASQAKEATAGQQERAIGILNHVCKKALEGFPTFLQINRIWLPKPDAKFPKRRSRETLSSMTRSMVEGQPRP